MVKADKLIKDQKEREDKKNDTFDKIFTKIEKKITISSLSNNYFTWYVIPEFIIGLPLYNLKECITYLEKKIQKNGFKTIVYEPNILYIDWMPKDKKKK